MKVLKAILEGLFYIIFGLGAIFFFLLAITGIFYLIENKDYSVIYIIVSLFLFSGTCLYVPQIYKVYKFKKEQEKSFQNLRKLIVPNYNKLQLNEEVIYIDKQNQLGLYSEIAIIKFVNKSALYHPFYIQFVKNKKYMWCNEHAIKSLSKLKIKRLVEHGV